MACVREGIFSVNVVKNEAHEKALNDYLLATISNAFLTSGNPLHRAGFKKRMTAAKAILPDDSSSSDSDSNPPDASNPSASDDEKKKKKKSKKQSNAEDNKEEDDKEKKDKEKSKKMKQPEKDNKPS